MKIQFLDESQTGSAVSFRFLFGLNFVAVTLPNPFLSLKIAKKIVFYLALTLTVVFIATTTSVFLFKDRIIHQFIEEANKSLSTPVKVGKIDVSSWNDFPNLAIVCTDVYVEDSQPGNYPLVTAKTVSFYINPIEVWSGTYSVRGLQITDSETNLKINPEGVNNYTIFKEKGHDSTSAIVFNLRNVRLRNAKVSYHDQRAHDHHIFQSEKLIASISIKGDLYDIDADGDVTTVQIGVGKKVFLKNKLFEVTSNLLYDDARKNLLIHPSSLRVNTSSFEVKGNYSFLKKNIIDITAKAKDTDIQSLLSLMPEEVSRKLAKYESDGEVYFDLSLKGEMGEHKSPFISIRFGCKDTRLFHPDYQSKITHANLEGSFASPSVTDLSRAELFLKEITGELNGRAFQADFAIRNFEDPTVSCSFKGELDAASILHFYPVSSIQQLEGVIRADVSMAGKISLLRKKSTAQQVKTQGSIEMKNIQLTVGEQKIHFRNLNGSLQFNHNDLALSNVSGQFENSDFKFNGFFKNVITFLLFENQPIGIESDLKSNFLDVDQLFSIGFGKKGSGDFNFHISPHLHLNFNCDIKSMKYKRFRPQNVVGDLLIKNQMAVSRNISLKVMGGDLSLNGIVNAKNPKAIEVVSAFKLNGIQIDSLFTVFENFHQDFIQDKHLKGKAFADVSMEMTLDEKLKLYSETLITDITFTVKNGEVNNFEPMQKLNKYLDDEGLSHLRFGDLKNEVHIEKRMIYLPQMEISSNVTVIQLSGTHSFDQKIDYRVIAPLRNRKKIDPDEAFGAIEEDNVGKPKLFLKIIGTAENYTVSLDKAAVKKKIVSDIKKEVKELSDAFKAKGKQKKKELELEKDEYFDWEEKR